MKKIILAVIIVCLIIAGILWLLRDNILLLFDTDGSYREAKKLAEYRKFLENVKPLTYELIDGTSTPGFVGRWFEKEIDGVKHNVTLSDGSAFYFMTDGAMAVNINFTVITTGKTPYFAYSIDGSEPVRQLITEPEIKLPDDKMHIVCIYADGMTEGEGKWKEEKGFAFKDITAETGRICGIKPTNKVIAYYGDSITEGIRALNMNADSDGNSATNAYSYYCSKALDAVTHNVGYGATGVISVGSFNTFYNAIDNISENVKEIEGFKPDVIVINHGTNDSPYRDADFRNELKKALDKLTEKYPETPVFYMIPFSQIRAENIREVLSEYPEITIVETEDWGVSLTDTYHPNIEGAKLAGTKLAEAIKTKLGADFFNV